MIEPRPTTRFVLEPSLVCNIVCKFCYHLHKKDTWKDTVKPFEQVKAIIDAGKERGNDYMDITGGEPTVYPYIKETIQYALNKGIRTCIITNGLTRLEKIDEIIDAGVDDWLISRHGLAETHDFITNRENSYNIQTDFINHLKRKKQTFRFNCVINRYNEDDIIKIAEEMVGHKPRIVNFINMNPHHEWQQKDISTSEVVADLRKVEPLLNDAIKLLEDHGIGVNVRYYPMCRLSDKYKRTVCNDLQVMFDPYEWDYDTTPKTFEKYYQWGVNCSKANEEKGEPCNTCKIHGICGGGNKHFHRVANECYGEQFDPVPTIDAIANGFYYFRQHNTMTLKPR